MNSHHSCKGLSSHLIIQSNKWKTSAMHGVWSATDHCTLIQTHLTSVCWVYCLLRRYPWLWSFSLSNLSLVDPPLLSSLTPHRSRAEFTFFTNPLSSATKTLSSPDQNRPVDTSSRVPEHSLPSSAPLIGSLRGKRCRLEGRWQEEKSYLAKSSGCCRLRDSMTSTASLGRDKERGDGGSKVRDDVWRTKHLQSEAVKTRNDLKRAPKNYNPSKTQELLDMSGGLFHSQGNKKSTKAHRESGWISIHSSLLTIIKYSVICRDCVLASLLH